MKIITRIFLVCPLLFSCGAFAQRADKSRDLDIYRQALTAILRFEKPARFAVLDKTLSANEIGQIKVPRQNPESQFTRNIKGVTSELELRLFYSNTGGWGFNPTYAFGSYDFNNINIGQPIEYLGIINDDQAGKEIKTPAQGKSGALDIIKFSKIAVLRNKALVYAEEKYISSDANAPPIGSGCGFLFRNENGNWHLVTMETLWQGAASF